MQDDASKENTTDVKNAAVVRLLQEQTELSPSETKELGLPCYARGRSRGQHQYRCRVELSLAASNPNLTSHFT